jgi:hypothetical protein
MPGVARLAAQAIRLSGRTAMSSQTGDLRGFANELSYGLGLLADAIAEMEERVIKIEQKLERVPTAGQASAQASLASAASQFRR